MNEENLSPATKKTIELFEGAAKANNFTDKEIAAIKKKVVISLIEADNGHFYKIEGEEFQEDLYLPSSTTILQCFPNKDLDIWRETTSPEEIKKKQEEGKRQGSKVHNIIELRLMGHTVMGGGLTDAQISILGLSDKKLISYLKEPLTKREEEALEGLENWWEEFKPIPVELTSGGIASELLVFSKKYGYAGTLDFMCQIWNKKTKKYELFIVDWKISKVLDTAYDLQLASYMQALEETYGKKFPKCQLGILQLGKNKCNYSFKVVKDKKKAWGMFLKTKQIFDFLNPNPKPKITTRREQFDPLGKYTKKGKTLKI